MPCTILPRSLRVNSTDIARRILLFLGRVAGSEKIPAMAQNCQLVTPDQNNASLLPADSQATDSSIQVCPWMIDLAAVESHKSSARSV